MKPRLCEGCVTEKDGQSEREPLIPKHGGYRKLKTFHLAEIIYDLTVRFCDRYIDKRSRTHDQMVQAARSGVQNIAEGSVASGTSKKTEIKLTNVARSSLVELQRDYEDYLRQRRLLLWAEDGPRRFELVARRPKSADEVAEWVKDVHDRGNGYDGQNGHDGQSIQSIQSIQSMKSMRPKRSTYREIAANAVLVLIGVTISLLERQTAAQARSFENEGGFTERLYRIRANRRRQGK